MSDSIDIILCPKCSSEVAAFWKTCTCCGERLSKEPPKKQLRMNHSYCGEFPPKTDESVPPIKQMKNWHPKDYLSGCLIGLVLFMGFGSCVSFFKPSTAKNQEVAKKNEAPKKQEVVKKQEVERSGLAVSSLELLQAKKMFMDDRMKLMPSKEAYFEVISAHPFEKNVYLCRNRIQNSSNFSSYFYVSSDNHWFDGDKLHMRLVKMDVVAKIQKMRKRLYVPADSVRKVCEETWNDSIYLQEFWLKKYREAKRKQEAQKARDLRQMVLEEKREAKRKEEYQKGWEERMDERIKKERELKKRRAEFEKRRRAERKRVFYSLKELFKTMDRSKLPLTGEHFSNYHVKPMQSHLNSLIGTTIKRRFTINHIMRQSNGDAIVWFDGCYSKSEDIPKIELRKDVFVKICTIGRFPGSDMAYLLRNKGKQIYIKVKIVKVKFTGGSRAKVWLEVI